jgi:hypothetical protein
MNTCSDTPEPPSPQASSLDWGLFYGVELDWPVQPAYDKRDTGTQATIDPEEIRRMARSFPGCGWTLKTSGFGVCVIDVDDSEILGLHGIRSLQRIAERIGYPATLTPFGHVPTPTCVTVRGMHFHYRGPGCFVPSGVLARNVEIKADGAAIRLPPHQGRAWDPHLRPTLPLAAFPSWAWIGGKPGDPAAAAQLWDLPSEAALAGRDFTPFGEMIAGRVVRGILKKANSTHECCGRVRALARLVLAGKISEAYALALIERLGPLLGPFTDESGFDQDRLLPAMRRSFMRACHGR